MTESAVSSGNIPTANVASGLISLSLWGLLIKAKGLAPTVQLGSSAEAKTTWFSSVPSDVKFDQRIDFMCHWVIDSK